MPSTEEPTSPSFPHPTTAEEPPKPPPPSSLPIALQVLSTTRLALSHLEQTYLTSPHAQQSLERSVTQISKSIRSGGKCVVAGVGKSGKIGEKIVATMNSLGVQSVFMHPTEAVHGDLGVLGVKDTLLLISNSARTPELLLLIPHIPPLVPIILMTSSSPQPPPLFTSRNPHTSGVNDILLPTPVHEPEQVSFGVAAPMTSTTVALVVGDALAMAVARRLEGERRGVDGEGERVEEVFGRLHPGGVVGLTLANGVNGDGG
ncbi:hypothetical protein FQN54_001426 [Arachnomyces sp. PD_36]|nr:hypothetical protein FQN54_001426 [Arachnomyces sp. PD_36]